MSIKLSKTTIDRRDLIRFTSMGAAGLYLVNLESLAEAAVCETVSTTVLSTTPEGYAAGAILQPGMDERNLFYFIDGCFTNFYLQDKPAGEAKKTVGLVSKVGGTDKLFRAIEGTAASNGTQSYNFPAMSEAEQNGLRILTKARVALHLEFEQVESNYVETVVLSDANHKVLGLRRLSPSDAIMKGDMRVAPYVVFDRLNLLEGSELHITYVRRIAGQPATIYQYKIPKEHVGPSRFDYRHLPMGARDQISPVFLNSLLGGDPTGQSTRGQHAVTYHGSDPVNDRVGSIPAFPFNGSGGYLTTAYYQQRMTPTHTTRAKLLDLKANGDFQFVIEKMHADSNLGHYMRYFLALDPVGRIMGGLHRDFTGTNYDGGLGNSDGLGAFKIKSGMMENSKGEDYRITQYKITDMPYVQLATEDILDAMAKITFRLR